MSIHNICFPGISPGTLNCGYSLEAFNEYPQITFSWRNEFSWGSDQNSYSFFC